MSKPVFSSGAKANLPSSVIKPGKIKFKEKFKLETVEDSQSAFLLKKDEEVESLIENDSVINKGGFNQ